MNSNVPFQNYLYSVGYCRSSASFKIVTRSEHFSGYGPAIAILTSMKLGVAKRRIGANSLGHGKKLIQSKNIREYEDEGEKKVPDLSKLLLFYVLVHGSKAL